MSQKKPDQKKKNPNEKDEKQSSNKKKKGKGKGDKFIAGAKAVGSTTNAIISAIKASKNLNPDSIVNALKDAGYAVKDIVEAVQTIKSNHPEWYTNDPELATIVNTISAYKPMNTFQYSDADRINAKGYIARIGYVDTIICPEDAKGTYLAITKLYNTLRRVNSGAANYNKYNLLSYVHNTSALVAIYHNLALLYRASNSTTSIDRLAPADIFAAFKVDYNSFTSNLADVRTYLIKLKKTIDILLPVNFDVLKRYEWMYSNCFADGEKKCQLYFNVISSVLLYTPSSQAVESKFVFENNENVAATWDILVNRINSIITYCMSESYTNITGDILKAYSVDLRYRVSVPDELQTITPIKDESYYRQLENAKPVGNMAEFGVDVQFDDSTQKVDMRWSMDYPTTLNSNAPALQQFATIIRNYYTKPMIETNENGIVQSGELISATRLIPNITDIDVDDGKLICTAQSSGILPTRIGFVADDRIVSALTTTPDITVYRLNPWFYLNDGLGDASEGNRKALCYYAVFEQFDHFPQALLISGINLSNMVGTIDWTANSYAILQMDQIADCAYVAAFSLYYINSKYRQTSNLEILD